MNAVSRQVENAVLEAKEETSDERRPNRKTSDERRSNRKKSHNAANTVITLHNTQQSTKSRGSELQRLHLIVPCQTRKMCSAIDPNWEVSYTFNKGRSAPLCSHFNAASIISSQIIHTNAVTTLDSHHILIFQFNAASPLSSHSSTSAATICSHIIFIHHADGFSSCVSRRN